MADKIVSWGGIDSKGTSGMGVTGSLNVLGNSNITQADGDGYLKIGNNGGGTIIENYNRTDLTLKANAILTTRGTGVTFRSTKGEPNGAILGVIGSGTTSSTTSFLIQNANASASLSVKDDGNVGIGNSSPSSLLSVGLQTGGTAATLADFRGGSDNDFIQVARTTVTDRGVKLYSSGQIIASSVYTSEAAYLFNNASSNTTTTGNRKFFQISGNWSPATGTSTWAQTLLTPTISASGDYSGTIRGIYYNPTVDSTTYGAHRAIETTAGDVVFSGGKVGIGTSFPSASLHVAGNTIITGSLTVTGSLILSGSNISTAWTSYTPTWEGQVSNPSLGDGSITGAYKVIGKTCFVRIKLNYGSTTSGGSGAWWFGLPLTGSNADGIQMACSMLDNGNAWYQGIANGTYAGYAHKTAIIAQSLGSNSSQGVDLGFPFVWGNTDSLQFAGSYEIA